MKTVLDLNTTVKSVRDLDTTVVVRGARELTAELTNRVPSPERPLAEPPSGSDLKPIPGDQGLPWAGRSIEMIADMLAFGRRRYERYGPLSWGGWPGTKMVSAIGPGAVGEILANKEKAFANGPAWGFFIGPFFTRGLMLLDGGEHLHHRRIMQQAFKRDRLVAYLAAMNPVIAAGLDGWRPDASIDLYDAVKRLTLDIATKVFVGAELGAEADALNRAFIDAVVAGLSVVRADVPGGGWHRGLRARQELEEYFRAQLPAKRESDGNDLFSVLCGAESEEGDRFSDDDVVNHMIFLLMAAHDTSTITLSMMVYYLATNPAWQERLREESRALGVEGVDHDAIDALTGMDLVMKETLRLNAPVGMIMREAVQDTSVSGYFVPAGTKISLNLYTTQRLPEYWPDPDRFDPERFADGRREDQVHQYAWVPFGGNVHKCIGLHFGGMEVKAILHQLLLRFRWSVPDGYEPPIDYGTGPHPGDGLPITLSAV